ncbi:hypothetical protein PYCC9005_000577 [Savitreella phatthalungensis]
MSISFAAPPVIERSVTPPSVSSGPAVHGAPSSSVSQARDTARRLSQSSLRSARSEGSRGRRAGASPPPDGRFTKRVSFDTFTNPDAAIFSLTLKVKHKEYRYRRQSRTYLIGYDTAEYSASALDWLLDTLADDGDEIIALRAIDPKSKQANNEEVSEAAYRAEARHIVDEIVERNEDDKAVSIIVELATGNVKSLLMHMIHLYHPDSLIVGTKGRNLNSISGLVPNSMSKWCLQNSPVPVIVVRPDRKRSKAKKKRMADPSRRSYLEILEKSSSFDDLNRMFSAAQLTDAHGGPAGAAVTGLSGERGRSGVSGSSNTINYPAQSSPLASPSVLPPGSTTPSLTPQTSYSTTQSSNPSDAQFDASKPGSMLMVPGMIRSQRRMSSSSLGSASPSSNELSGRPASSTSSSTTNAPSTTRRGKSPLGRLFGRSHHREKE